MKETLKGVIVRDVQTSSSTEKDANDVLAEKDRTIRQLKEKIQTLEAHTRFLEKELQKHVNNVKRKSRVEIDLEAEERIQKAKDVVAHDKKYNKQ